MTNDYKEKLLKWLTANYTVGSGTNDPQFQTPITKNNNFASNLSSQFPNGYFIFSSVQGNNINNYGTGFIVISGVYYKTVSTLSGFVVILDEENNIVQTITKYSNGTDLGGFVTLNVSEDGNFYGVETTSGGLQGPYRLVLMNNIVAKLPNESQYKIVLRQAYNVPNTTQLYTSQINGIIKAPGSTKYCVYGSYANNQYMQPLVTEIDVTSVDNVTFTDYKYTSNVVFYASDCLPSWNSNNELSFKLVGIDILNGTDNVFCMYSSQVGNTNMTRQQIGSSLGQGLSMDIKIISVDDIYAAFLSGGANEVFTMYKVNTSNWTLSSFYTKTTPAVQAPHSAGIGLIKVGLEVFYNIVANKDTTPSKYIYYVGKIIGTTTYEYNLGEIATNLSVMFTAMKKQFNLYDYCVQLGNTMYDIKQIYNSLNYNGLPYQALNSMVPESAVIYDENDIVIFARNLYNRIITNNTTVSTVEIPNDFINEITIQLKELISQTNNTMVSDTTQITTNIYEDLLINFANSILIENRNNPENYILNDLASARLNNSVSNPDVLDYDNCKITKYRINYQDGTSIINNLDTNLTYVGLSTNYLIYFYTDSNNKVISIDLLSNDENTVYQTIDCKSLTQNKVYSINQQLEIL